MKERIEERLLEASEVGRRVGVSPDTVRADADAGRLPIAERTSRGARLFRPSDVEAYRLTRLERQERLGRRAGSAA